MKVMLVVCLAAIRKTKVSTEKHDQNSSVDYTEW